MAKAKAKAKIKRIYVRLQSATEDTKGPFIATQLNSTRRRVELRRYKRALRYAVRLTA